MESKYGEMEKKVEEREREVTKRLAGISAVAPPVPGRDPLFDLAYKAQEEGMYELAKFYYNRVIERDPTNAIAYNNRGAAYDDLGEYQKAIKDYDRAIELDPNLAPAYYNRACAYSLKFGSEGKEDDKKQAVADLQKAIELDPEYKQMAKTDEDFNPILDEPEFQELF